MNYDFLTLEDWNTILGKYKDFFCQDYVIDFSNFDLEDGNSLFIDDWITLTKKNGIVTLNAINSLITGTYSVTGADYTETISKDNFKLQLTNVEDNCKIRIQLSNTDALNIHDNLLDISPANQFIVYPAKQTLNFTVKNKNGELVDGFVSYDEDTPVPFYNGECTINVNAKNKEYILLKFQNEGFTTKIPIKCIQGKTNFTFIDPEFNVLYKYNPSRLGFYHKNIDNPSYKLMQGDNILDSKKGGLDASYVYFDLNGLKYPIGDLPLKLIINNVENNFNVPVEKLKGSWFDFDNYCKKGRLYDFNLIEDSRHYVNFSDKDNSTVTINNLYGELNDMPHIENRKGKLIFNNFNFKNITYTGSLPPYNCDFIVHYNNAFFEFNDMVFEDIDVSDITSNGYSIFRNNIAKENLVFNNCTFKNVIGTIFNSYAIFNNCTFIQTEPISPHGAHFRIQRMIFNNCTFRYEFSVNELFSSEYYIFFSYANSTINNIPINANSFDISNNNVYIDIEFIDKRVSGSNGMIYRYNNEIYYYNLVVEDL